MKYQKIEVEIEERSLGKLLVAAVDECRADKGVTPTLTVGFVRQLLEGMLNGRSKFRFNLPEFRDVPSVASVAFAPGKSPLAMRPFKLEDTSVPAEGEEQEKIPE